MGTSYQLPSLLLHQAEAVTSDTLKLAAKPLLEKEPQFWQPRRQWLELVKQDLLPEASSVLHQDSINDAEERLSSDSRALLSGHHLDSTNKVPGEEEEGRRADVNIARSLSTQLQRQGSVMRSGILRQNAESTERAACACASVHQSIDGAAAAAGRRWGSSMVVSEEALAAEMKGSRMLGTAGDASTAAAAAGAASDIVPRMLAARPDGFWNLHQDFADRLIPKVSLNPKPIRLVVMLKSA
jgi:hypothetical protein